MNIHHPQTAVRRYAPACPVLFAAVLAAALLGGISAQAQTVEAWASASDNYTNGPVGGDWNPAISDSPTNWPDNLNGSASSAGGYIVVFTNGGTCNYAGSSGGDPVWTNTIGQLWMGGTANGVGGNNGTGGSLSNVFIMSGGSLTLADAGGTDFAIGGNSTSAASIRSTNYFTMSDGTFTVTNSTGDNWIGLAQNSRSTVSFNGGTAVFSDLKIGGKGYGTVTINGGNVTMNSTLGLCSLSGGSGGPNTLNLISGTLNVTNNQLNLNEGVVAGLSSIVNISGGTLNVLRLQYGKGTAAKSTNIVNISGGTINFGPTGYGRNGATATNLFIMSGGTISCLPGSSAVLSSLIVTILTNTPGPGLVTIAPPAGQSITLATMSGPGSVNIAGPGVTIEAGANTYTGDTIVSGGILAVNSSGTIAGRIILAANTAFDVSAQASYTLSAGQTLSNSTSTAMINGNLNTGSGIVSLLYAPGTPALMVTTNNSANSNANPATLTLSLGTTFNINNTGSALTNGNYLIISTSSGATVAGAPPGTVTISGGGVQAGNTAALSIGGDGQLYLVVAALPPPPVIGNQSPVPYTNPFTLYAGANPTFSVSASSATTIYYQWFLNGAGVGGATNASLTLSNVSVGFFTNYCVVSNSGGSTTSVVWTAAVIADPTNSTGGLASYPQSVLAANPIGYWRLNEPDDGNGSSGYSDGNPGVIAHDYWGGNNGIYTNTGLGGYYGFLSAQPPYSSDDTNTTPAGFGLAFADSDAYGIGGIDFGAPTNTSAAFSIEAWVDGYTPTSDSGIVSKGYNGAEQFDLDTGGPTNINQSSPHNFRFMVQDASGAAHSVNSSVQPSLGVWHHLVGVCDEVNSNVTLYVDGVMAGHAAIAPGSGILASSRAMLIGARPSNSTTNANDLQFVGFVQDVVVYNYALSANQVAAQYVSIGAAPVLNPAPPSSVTFNGGEALTISAGVVGTSPLFYWWYDVNGGTNVASGSTNGPLLNPTLTVNSAPFSWNNDTLDLIVSNALGGTNFAVTLTLQPAVEAWASTSDNYTNGPVGGDWTPAIADSPTNWPDNFNGSASSILGYIVVVTNNGTCNYAGSSGGDPNYTNTINDLYIGGTGNGMGGGGISNNFVMSGGSLTLADTAGPAFTVGGNSTGGAAGAQSTNYFTMTGGTLVVTNSFTNGIGDCSVGLGTKSAGTMNFNGGTAVLSDLVIGGRGVGIVNINGGNVTISSGGANGLRAINFDILSGGNGTLNIISGTLTATNGQVDLAHAALAGLTSTINMSGGTFNVSRIQYATGSTAATNIVNFSGGTINFGTSGYGRNGASDINSFIMSGGTISCLPGNNPTLSGLIPTLLTNAPGPGLVTIAPLAGQSITLAGGITGAGNLIAAGPGVVIMSSASTYTGNTTVSGGILSLNTAGSIASCIIIAGNATFDVSEESATYTLNTGQTLSNSTSTAIINGNLNTGSGIVSLLYAPGTPSLMVTTNNSLTTNAAAATLTLSPSTTFNINNTGVALGAGSYLIISTNTGATVAGMPPGTVTVSGGGIQAGDVGALSIGSDGQLYLMVAAVNTNPTNLLFSVSASQLTLSWPADHIGWELQAQTNSLSAGLGVNWVAVLGSTTTNQIVIPIDPANGTVFYRLVYPPQ